MQIRIGNDQRQEVTLEYPASLRRTVAALYKAADDEGTIQARDMARLLPADRALHCCTRLYDALLAAGCVEVEAC
jgi:hypothetical protein